MSDEKSVKDKWKLFLVFELKGKNLTSQFKMTGT